MKPTITTRRMSLGPTTLTKDRTDQFILDSMSHHMTTFPSYVQVFLFNYGNQLCNNRLLGPRCQGHSSLDAPSELNPPQRIPSLLFFALLVPQAEG